MHALWHGLMHGERSHGSRLYSWLLEELELYLMITIASCAFAAKGRAGIGMQGTMVGRNAQ